jgi:hypothetical protein
VAAVGLFLGGAVGGRHRRTRRGAIYQGVVIGLLTATVASLSDGLRDLIVARSIAGDTISLWLGIEAASLVLALIGALFGRRRYLKVRRKVRRSRT